MKAPDTIRESAATLRKLDKAICADFKAIGEDNSKLYMPKGVCLT